MEVAWRLGAIILALVFFLSFVPLARPDWAPWLPGGRKAAIALILLSLISLPIVGKKRDEIALVNIREHARLGQVDAKIYLSRLKELAPEEEWLAALQELDPAEHEAEMKRRVALANERVRQSIVKREAAAATAAKSDAQIVCMNAIEASAKFPSEVDFEGVPGIQSSGSQVTMRGRVKLMNGLGAMIPHVYLCKYDSQRAEVVDLAVLPG